MSTPQITYFRERLLAWRDELLQAAAGMLSDLRETDFRKADPLDVGSLYAENERNLTTRNRRNSLISEIDRALLRMQNGTYGYCEMTGGEIGIRRLLVMPLAIFSVEAQQRLERMRVARS